MRSFVIVTCVFMVPLAAPRTARAEAPQAGAQVPVVVVVEPWSRSQREVAVALAEYLTRERSSDPAKSRLGCFRLLAASDYRAARKVAEEADAFAIIRIKAGRLDTPFGFSVGFTIRVATASGRSEKTVWRERMSGSVASLDRKDGDATGNVAADETDRPDDPPEFASAANIVLKHLTATAAQVWKHRLEKTGDGGWRLSVEVTNNTNSAVDSLHLLFRRRDRTFPPDTPPEDIRLSYTGEAIQPGTHTVTVAITPEQANTVLPASLPMEDAERGMWKSCWQVESVKLARVATKPRSVMLSLKLRELSEEDMAEVGLIWMDNAEWAGMSEQEEQSQESLPARATDAAAR